MPADKAQQFLFIVQTLILTNSVNLATDPETNKEYRHEFSATGVAGIMYDAIYASERIPVDMDAHEAAITFCSFMLGNLRHIEENASGRPMKVPSWFARA